MTHEPQPALAAAAESFPTFPLPLHATARPADMRVMSFNLRTETIFDALNHWELRKGLLVETVREFDPDLLGTQECQKDQGEYLRERLPEYDFVGAGRNDGRARGEMCGVFYKRARFQKLDAGHFWLSKTPAKPGSKSWGSVFPRMVTWVKLRPTDGGQDFCWFNTHFDAWGGRARAESAKLLRQRMDAIAGDLSVIVTGDFNADAGSDPYVTLVRGTKRGDGKLTDTFLAANPGRTRLDGTRHKFRGGKGGPRIDWVLASGEFQTLDADIVYDRGLLGYPSDHFPVTAVLRPTQARQAYELPVARIE